MGKKNLRGANDAGPVIKIGAGIALSILLIPVFIVILTGLNSGDHLTFPPEGFSLRWIFAFFESEVLLNAFLFSFGLALITMFISTLLGTMAAIFITRFNFPGVNFLRAIFLSPLILPGIVLGLALYIFYISSGWGLSRTYTGMVIAHVIVTMPDVHLEEAARSLGANPLTAFRKVTLPNISNGVMAGSIFAFIVSFGQFDVSLFMATPSNTPLPIALYWSLRYTFEPTAAAAGIFAIFLVVTSMLITSRLVNLKKFSGVKFS